MIMLNYSNFEKKFIMAKKPLHNKGNQSSKRNQRKSKRNKISSHQRKHSNIDKQVKDPEAGMRLNKYIANSGICSRRDADIYIASGVVTVNDEVITQMGYKVKLTDDVRFDGRRISPVQKEYVLLNKPAGFFVTGSLEKDNKTVMDLVLNASKSRITPVGRLETSAKGLLLFTNDGTLEKKLARKGIKQIFEIELNKELELEDLKQIREGIHLREGLIKPIAIDYVENKNRRNIGIEIVSTSTQILSKLFKKLDYEIVHLDRVMYGNLTKKNLPRGKYRHLTKQEVINLGML